MTYAYIKDFLEVILSLILILVGSLNLQIM